MTPAHEPLLTRSAGAITKVKLLEHLAGFGITP
jgi:hypothetical protein